MAKIMLSYKGKSQPIGKWAKEVGFSDDLIRHRLAYGWTVEDALLTPVMANNAPHRYLTAFGQTRPLRDWALDYGVKYDTLIHRLRRGWGVERAIKTPTMGHGGDRQSKQWRKDNA